MRSFLAILLIAVQFVRADSSFNINITNNPIYHDTYLTAHHGHIGAGLYLALISAAPDPVFSYQPIASSNSTLAYGHIQYLNSAGFESQVGFSPIGMTTSNTWSLYIGDPGANFTFDSQGSILLLGADSNAGWKFCNVTDSVYGNFTAVSWFNGTGTPDNKECVDIGLVRG